ncbi:Rab family GTPase [Maribacter sp.]|uniref:Rab family GTPase n=1 Tax=Maribacter sp. TaxID=1897614 RepID=UPI0025C4A9CA|nr:Rab family GTPase [Maribacter sp.]
MNKSKKIVVLGHFGVGKTSLIRRFVSNSFSDKYLVSIGVHITKKVVEISPDENLSFIIWDLEGTDEIHTIRDAYLLGTHGALFVFDVTRPSTFQDLKKDLKIITSKIPKVPILVIGNKVDLVVEKELKELLKEYNIDCNFLTSAKTGDAVNTVFQELAKVLNV